MPQRYSDTVMDHFMSPRHQGPLKNPSGTGVSGAPGRGPFLVFQVRCENGIVTEAWFQSHNCGVTVAGGSVLTELVEGKTPEQCRAVNADTLTDSLDGVPPDKRHVPEFAVAAMKMAIDEADV